MHWGNLTADKRPRQQAGAALGTGNSNRYLCVHVSAKPGIVRGLYSGTRLGDLLHSRLSIDSFMGLCLLVLGVAERAVLPRGARDIFDGVCD